MIVADKKVLEANLAKGTLSIQYKLNILYRENLNSLSTQSALIAIVGLVGFQQGNDYDTPTTSATIFVSLLLFLGLNIGTIASFIAYTLSSVEVIWGPIMGLSGDHHSEVIEATRHMLIQQNEAMLWLVIGVFAIISTPYFYVLLLVDWKCSIPVGIAVLVGYYVIWTQGVSAYNLFNHDAAWKGLDNALYQEYQEDKSAKSKSPLNTKAAIAAATTLFSGSVATLAQKEEEREHWFKEQIDKTTERIEELVARGVLWIKPFQLLSSTTMVETSNCFRKMFVNIHHGSLDIYRDENDFKLHQNPLNSVPINLSEYHLELDLQKIMQHTHLNLSVTSSLRSALTGTQEVSFQDSMNADFDVQVATKRFRFSLIPKTFSELVSRDCLHFMAEDMTAFKLWVGVIRDINSAVQELEKLEELRSQMKGSTNVIQAVSAANQAKL